MEEGGWREERVACCDFFSCLVRCVGRRLIWSCLLETGYWARWMQQKHRADNASERATSSCRNARFWGGVYYLGENIFMPIELASNTKPYERKRD